MIIYFVLKLLIYNKFFLNLDMYIKYRMKDIFNLFRDIFRKIMVLGVKVDIFVLVYS